MRMWRAVTLSFSIVLLGCFIMGSSSEALALDETPARPGEWGFRPFDGKECAMDPPGFVWRPQKNAAGYDLECSRDTTFANAEYRVGGITYNCHCPPKTFEQGTWRWRFRMVDKKGEKSDWSKVRSFAIGPDAVAFPMPAREGLLGRIPKQHPRLFVRPEQIPELRKRAQGDLKPMFDSLVKQCEKIMKAPLPTEEPPKYPKGMKRGSDPWRKIWWGNRRYTTAVLNGAATLAFTRLLGGKE